MSQYQILTEVTVVDYLKSHTDLFTDTDQLTAVEFGDGNLNLVFKVTCSNKNVAENTAQQTVIVKQALPYVRCVGESWPLTLDRARIEAEVLQLHGEICPEHTVKVLHQDNQQAVTVLEDLSAMEILRGAQNQAKQFPLVGEQVARYIAHTAFYTSDLYLNSEQKKARVIQFTNPELCKITEDLFFTDPYTHHERNNYAEELTADVDALTTDTQLKLAVAKLKARFISCPQALLHGDVHTGSVFVSAQHTKLIDPEFGFYGPIGFDLGSFIANLMLNYFAQLGRIEESSNCHAMQQHLLEQADQCITAFVEQFKTLMNAETSDATFKLPEYQQHYVQQILSDACGYAGTELIRRTVGLAHVEDVDGIEDDTLRITAQRRSIELGKTLILAAENCKTAAEFIGYIQVD